LLDCQVELGSIGVPASSKFTALHQQQPDGSPVHATHGCCFCCQSQTEAAEHSFVERGPSLGLPRYLAVHVQAAKYPADKTAREQEVSLIQIQNGVRMIRLIQCCWGSPRWTTPMIQWLTLSLDPPCHEISGWWTWWWVQHKLAWPTPVFNEWYLVGHQGAIKWGWMWPQTDQLSSVTTPWKCAQPDL